MKLKSIQSRTTIPDGGLNFLTDLVGVVAAPVAAPLVDSQAIASSAASAPRSLAKAQANSPSSPSESASLPSQPWESPALLASETRTDLPVMLYDAGLITADTTVTLHQWDAPVTESLRLETVFLDNFDHVQDLDPTDLGPPLDVRGEMRGHGGPHWLPGALTQDRWDIDI
jgi:hypothetical protein